MDTVQSIEANHQIKRPFGHERRVRVRAEYIAMLMPFVSTEPTRYYLNGIHIEPHPQGGALLVATNGHILGVVHDKDASVDAAWTCAIPKMIAQACTKKVREALDRPHSVDFIGRNVYVTTARFNPKDEERLGDPAELSDQHLAAAFSPAIDGTYPDWRRVIAMADPSKACTAASFNSRYLDAFRDVARVRGSESITTRLGDAGNCPTIVEVDAVPEFLGLLMPMRGRAAEAFRLPAWLAQDAPLVAAE